MDVGGAAIKNESYKSRVSVPCPMQGQMAGCCEEGNEAESNIPTRCTHFVLATLSGATAGRTRPVGPIATSTLSPTANKRQPNYRREYGTGTKQVLRTLLKIC
jgi:hypothetical protein